MRLFVTGTDTGIGKTIICSWLCLHTNYAYFKPIQTGTMSDVDSKTVKRLSNTKIHDEVYALREPVSPHLAAKLSGACIDMNKIRLPQEPNLIVEGAGGVMVPLNDQNLMVDLMRHFSIPVILVARSTLGTINHTLMSIEVLRLRDINPLGVILKGEQNENNKKAIEYFGKTDVLAWVPHIPQVTRETLLQIELGEKLRQLLV